MYDRKGNELQKKIMLNKAIKESLLSLGETIMNTILWHMRQKGFILDDTIDTDVDVFFNYLSEIVGDVADVVMTDVYTNLEAQCLPQFNKGQNLLLLPRHDRDDKRLKKNNNSFGNDDEMETKERIRLLLASYTAKDNDADRNENSSGVIGE